MEPHELQQLAESDEVRLRPTLTEELGPILGWMTIAAFSASVALTRDPAAWWAVGLFGIPVLLRSVACASQRFRLRINADGFEIRTLFRTLAYRWEDVAGVAAEDAFVGSRVEFRLAPGVLKLAPLARMNRFRLPFNYGMPAPLLANLMLHHRWRRMQPISPPT